jgi:hypothetical protein
MKAILRSSVMVLLVVLGVYSEASATHAMGGDLTYECLGHNQYRIRLKFFRDCSGIDAPISPSLTIAPVNCFGASSMTVAMNQVNMVALNTVCPGQLTTCDGGAAFGVQRYDYEAVVTLPTGCTDWRVSWDYCCRNNAITTIYSPGQQDIYLETFIKNVPGLCNNSPTFSNNPVAFICLGQNFTFNHGVIDAEGDSLAFSLINPRNGPSTPVQFFPGRSAVQPMGSVGPFTINPISGTINFTPSTIEVGVMTVLVREFRNGVQIGSVMRDLQFIITNCSNAIPSASGINGTNDFFVTACPDQPICFDIFSADANQNQNVTLTWNAGIPGATFTVSGGSRPTGTFCWTPTFADVNLNANTFTVTVVDNACPNVGTQTFSYSIMVPSPFVDVVSANAVCGQSNGSLTAIPQIANTNYAYAWSNGVTTAANTGLTPGTYGLTVTDPSGCSVSTTGTVSNTGETVTANGTVTDASCGASNGSITLFDAINSPNTITWSNASNGAELSNLEPGSYSVTVTTPGGCSTSNTFTVGGTAAATIALTASANGCTGTGSVEATVSGTAPFVFAWSNGADVQNIQSVPSGNYGLTVTDANGCSAEATAELVAPGTPMVTALGTVANCGNSDGTLSATVDGGTAPYTFSWSNGATDQTLTGMPAGAYLVNVTDANGCAGNAEATVGSTAAATVSLTATADGCTGTGSVDATVNGAAPFAFAWSNGADTEDLSGVASGNYSLVATDANGCLATASIELTAPTAPAATATATLANCGSNDGTASVSATDGTAPYAFAWNNGSADQQLAGLSAGTYSVVVTDANGCSASAEATVGSTNAAELALTATPNGCTGTGSVDATVNGAAPFAFAWSNGADTEDLSGVSTGNYSLVVTDANGCSAAASVALTAPTTPTATTTATNATCAGGDGTASVSATGGTAPYAFAWSNGSVDQQLAGLAAGTYSVVVTDANGCSTSAEAIVGAVTCCNVTDAGQIGANQSHCGPFDPAELTSIEDPSGGAGDLEIVWIMSVGCTGNWTPIPGATGLTYDPGLVTETTCFRRCARRAGCITFVGESNIITITVFPAIAVTATANGNTATATANGGTAPFAFLWSNGATTATATNLLGGTYTVTVTDANGCTGTASVQIALPCQIFTNTTATAPGCSGGCAGIATVTAINGNAPYTFVWNNGQTGATATGLCPDLYHVTVTDASGCSATACVTVPEGEPLMTGTIVTNATCNGTCDGAINLFVSGGTEPYTFDWSNGATTEDLANACPGSYDVTVTDATGCTAHACVVVLGSPMSVTATATNVTCNGACNGSVTASATGQAPFTYLWNNGATTATLSQRCPGTYRVTVTAANGCSGTAEATVTQPTGLQVSGQITHPTTCNGGINLTVSGGTAPYTFFWNNGATTEDRTGLCAGTYFVTVRDANGCTRSMSFKLVRRYVTCPAPHIKTNCYNLCNARVMPNPSNGPVTVMFELAEEDDVRVELTDQSGRVVDFRTYEQTARVHDLRFDLAGRAPGVYYVRIVTSFGAHSEKVVFQP